MGWFTSDSVVAFITSAVDKFAKFVGAIEDTGGGMTAFRNTLVFLAKAIVVVSSALVTNVTWMKIIALTTTEAWQASKLYTLGLKAKVVMENIGIVASQAYAAVTMLLTGNIKGATQAIRVMATTMKTTPWGLVLSLVAAVAAAYIVFADSEDKATRQAKMFNDVIADAAIEVKKEKDALAMRLKVANDMNRSEKDRKRALEEIIALNPEMLKGLTLENIATKEGKKLLDEYIVALEKSARAKAVASKITELYGQLLDVEKSSLKDNISYMEQLWNVAKTGGGTMPGSTAYAILQTALKNKEGAKQEIQEVIDQLLKEQAANYTAKIEVDADPKGTATLPGDAGKDKASERAAEKARKLREKSRKEAQDEAKKAIEDNLDLERKAIDDRLALMTEGFDKEEAL
ncbi:hypothetical protein ACLI09_09535 [Flavobacterium sp. RHBU_24]|uniref:hypothetical protein n=1 Tax=Flavobacterium sp. RHBU_24 TaxID=3391185 RepID=UPI003984DEF0